MIIVDRALEARAAANNPIRVGMIGAGFMAKGITNQIVNTTPGVRLVAISNRTLDKAAAAYQYADVSDEDVRHVTSVSQLEATINAGKYAVTDDAMLLCEAGNIDALIEVTGALEFGAQVVMHAIKNGKHVILMNAEIDGTIGPILRVYAKKAGVIVSACDGDQPGVEMNLYRFVKGIGLRPLVCGNIKGLQDPYRTPTTQAGFAAKWGQNPTMVTSFADGTKISFEQGIVANATGMKVPKRGMNGWDWTSHVDDLTKKYDIAELEAKGGVIDYVVGAKPGPGIYVIATHDDPKQRHYLNLYKLGEGPLYSFYTPYHLCHFEAPQSVARVVLFGDSVMDPLAGPVVDVVTTAKRDLVAGEVIDGLGGYLTYGQAENADVVNRERLLPIGVAEDCILKRDLPKDHVLTYDDVIVPKGRLIDQLRAEQTRHFAAHMTP